VQQGRGAGDTLFPANGYVAKDGGGGYRFVPAEWSGTP
jgi:hypothetical protein